MHRELKHGRTLRLDPASLSAAMNRRGISVEQLANSIEVSTGSVNNWLSGRPAYRSTAQRIAEALETTVMALLEPSSQLKSGAAIHEYILAEVLSDWKTTSNGMRYQICRLRHTELDRQARGKRFDLRTLPTDVAQLYETRIKRHPRVCGTLSKHPNVIRNLTAFKDPIEQFYWIVDEWVDGQLLEASLHNGRIHIRTSLSMLLDVAHGLAALHREGIIRRELGPSNILVCKDDSGCLLTEFELAKLTEQVPTVSTGNWPEDPYRAPEAISDDIDCRADVYSWSRVAAHLLLTELPEVGSEATLLSQLPLPARVLDVLVRGLSVFRDSRPSSIEEVTLALEEWRPQ